MKTILLSAILLIGCSVTLLASAKDDGYKEGHAVGIEWAGSGSGIPTVAAFDQIAKFNAQRHDVQPADLDEWVKAFKSGFEAGYKAANQKAFK